MSDDIKKSPGLFHSSILMDCVIIAVLAILTGFVAFFTGGSVVALSYLGTAGTPVTGSLVTVAFFLSIALVVFAVRRWAEISHVSDEIGRVRASQDRTNAKLMFLNNITRYDMLNELTLLHRDLEHAGKSPEIIRVNEAIERIRRQIKFTKEYQDIGATPPSWQNVADAIMRAKVGVDLGNVNFEMDIHDVEIYADPLLEKVFYYLISNSLKYGGSRLSRIHIFRKKVEDHFVIICEDDGVGISQEMKAFLFPKEWGSRKHAGYGLFLIRETLAVTGITIWESGTPGEGARFEITVPQGVFRQV